MHTGLTLAEEAALFDRLNRQRRAPTTWDHWFARRASKDETVEKIEKAVAAVGLKIDPAPKDGNVRCTSTLEKLAALGGRKLVEETLRLVVDCWGKRLDAYDAPIVHGLGLVLHYLDAPIDRARLWESMLDIMPRQLKTQALALRDMTNGSQPKLVAVAVMTLCNRRAGKKSSCRPTPSAPQPETLIRLRSREHSRRCRPRPGRRGRRGCSWRPGDPDRCLRVVRTFQRGRGRPLGRW